MIFRHYLTSFISYLSDHLWPCLLWSALILFVCLMPVSDLPHGPALPGLDKVVHTGLFAVWAFLWAGYRPRWKVMIITAGILMGAGIEFLQEITAFGRSFEWWDLVADIAGVCIGYLARTCFVPLLWPETMR